MNPIEQAVIECDGVWPSRATRNISIGWNGPQDGEPHHIRFVDHDEDGLTRSISREISKPEFMVVRQRLEGRPEQWPANANILTFNANYSQWIFGTYKDASCGYDGHWLGLGPGEWLEEMAVQGHYFGDASLSLERRPEPGHKEGEGVKWEPGVDLPPIGEVVTFRSQIHAPIEVEIVGHTKNPATDVPVALFWLNGSVQPSIKQNFSRAKSHRDKVIEAAKKKYFDPISHECPPLENKWLDRLFGAMVDDGSLKLPGEEQ